jgi:alkanesulfonate monooxygenase SsuD/methylene tetrahydromethanopterin reductase-like flavin-dependent oxidoreductase (luciferase family)
VIQLGTEIRWQDRHFEVPLERILLSERLGYDAVFTAEGWGSECFTPLAFVAAHAKHLKLGTRVARITGRSAVTLAMTYRTLDHLAGGGRVIAGLGNGDPVLAETVDGVPWGGRPAARMRDTVAIMRQSFAGEPVEHRGSVVSVPYRGPDAQRDPLGAPLPPARVGLDPVPEIPIMLGASFPRTIAQAAEIADGWMPANFAPGMLEEFRPLLERGFSRAGGGKTLADFAIWAHVDVNVDDDVRTAMRPFKEYVITWSQRQRRFMEARGYGHVPDHLREILFPGEEGIEPAAFAVRVQAMPKTGPRWDAALDAVPDEYVDEGNWLAGPLPRIRTRVARWLDCGLTGLVVRYGHQFTHDRMAENLDVFRVIAEAAGKEPRTGWTG